MKISYVFASFNPGGCEIQQCEVLIRLHKAGHDVEAILPYGASVFEKHLGPWMEKQGFPIVNLADKPDKISAIERELERFAPDVECSNGYPMTLTASLAANAAGVPVRVIRMTSDGFVRGEFPQDDAYELAGHAAATHAVGNSQAVVDSFDLYKGVSDDKRRIIPNGVDIPTVTKAMRDKSRGHWGAGGNQLIGCLANHRPDGIKNQVMLIRAAAEVIKSYPNIKVLLVGYQTEYTSTLLAEITRLGLLDKVFLPGRIDDLDLIAGWDIAVNCSRTEGLSNAVMQGMAYGIPTIATAVGGNVDLVANHGTGLLVDDNDPDDLAAAICELLDNPKLAKEIGAAGRRKMKEEYGWDKVIEQWVSLFEEGLAEVGYRA
jgi:glycosyltransferase involved in cell wall biosynthesis